MAINTHISRWIKESELTIDYYILFIKAWIPFNAWYMHNYYDEDRNNDSKIINFIKDNTNPYRDKIKSLLMGSSTESSNFKSYIWNLHNELIEHPIPSYENRIAFDNIIISKNPNKIHSFDKGGYSYKCEFKDQLPKTEKRFICEVIKKKDQRTLHRIDLEKWNIQNLENDCRFIAIQNDKIRNNLKSCFQEINPNKPINIILDNNRVKKSNNIKIDDNLYFQNDINLVSKVIIHLIYDLRCKLFHGEIEPNETNAKIYKYTYYIQRMLIKEFE